MQNKENDSRTGKALQHKPFPKLSPLRLYQGHEEVILKSKSKRNYPPRVSPPIF